MLLDFATDLATALHMLSFSVGIGLSVFIEATLLPRFLNRIEKRDMRTLMIGHHMIRYALAGLWITGVAIMCLKVGLAGADLTPKLATKFAVVGVLTLNMALIETTALPLLKRGIGQPLSAFSTGHLRLLGAIGGISAACWIMALCLGAIGVFKTLALTDLAALFLPGLILASLAGAALAPLIVRRRLTAFQAA